MYTETRQRERETSELLGDRGLEVQTVLLPWIPALFSPSSAGICTESREIPRGAKNQIEREVGVFVTSRRGFLLTKPGNEARRLKIGLRPQALAREIENRIDFLNLKYLI